MTINSQTNKTVNKQQTIFVSPSGNDTNNGDINHPFKTINAAKTIAKPGSIIYLRQGIYNEQISLNKSGSFSSPISFSSYQNEKVIISGTNPITGKWEKWKTNPNIWRVKLAQPTTQLFIDTISMIEARFPNMKFHENWNVTKKWTLSETGSEFGKIKSNAISKLNINLTGALVFLKIGKGNDCFSRRIKKHYTKGNTFTWDTINFIGKNFTGEDGDLKKMQKYGLDNNKFFVTGLLDLLDSPSEWFYDKKDGWLYFYPPNNENPNHLTISTKNRNSAFTAFETSNIKIEGIHFIGCNIEFKRSEYITIKNCKFTYPTYRFNHFNRLDKKQSWYIQPITLEGNNNCFINNEISWADIEGIQVTGNNNKVTNNVIHDCNLHGKHPGAAIISGKGTNLISQNTIYNCGGVAIYSINRGPVVSDKIHAFNVGLYCSDASGYYIPWGKLHSESVSKYSWFHNIHGIGMRCDSHGENIYSHHNVVWECSSRNCKWQGASFHIYNNTYIATNKTNSGLLLAPTKEEDINNFYVKNNITLYGISIRNKTVTKTFDLDTENMNNNFVIKNELVAKDSVFTPENLLKAIEPQTVDKGVDIENITNDSWGKSPDIGAYEKLGDYWSPGADWLPNGLTPPKTIGEAETLAKELQKKW